MQKKASLILAVISIITGTLPRWIHPISGDSFCKYQSAAFVFMALGAILRGKDKIERTIWDWTFLLTINNMLDEVVGIAEKTSIWELLFATLITVWTVYRLRKQCH